MTVPILFIADSVVGEPRLPNLPTPLQIPLGAEGESSLDQLDRFLDRLNWRDEEVQVIGHDDKPMQLVASSDIMVDRCKHQSRPAVVAKERRAARCLSRDKVSELVAS